MSAQPFDHTDPRFDQEIGDTHAPSVDSGQTTPQTVRSLTSKQEMYAGSPSTQPAVAPRSPEAEMPAGSHSPQRAVDVATPDLLALAEAQTAPSTIELPTSDAATSTEPCPSTPAIEDPAPSAHLPVVDPLLFVHVTAHGDLEQQRIASQNRLRILTTTEPDEDGVMRGFGLDPSHPDVGRLAGITDALAALEHGAELNLKRALRKCAIHPWVKAQVGLGEKQVARLLGVIGDPYWHLAEDRPRTVSELWAYCGLHVLPASHASPDTRGWSAGGAQTSDPGGHVRADHQTGNAAGVAARRMKGQRANWSTEAKTRAYLIAASCIKQRRSPYRAVYDARRAHTATTHPGWTPGHSHNDALRITSKAVLRDLWREAKRLHDLTEGTTS